MLPPPNKTAFGLNLTEDEWQTVMNILIDSEVQKAWIFGSRATGRRRLKTEEVPLDIDLAILPVWPFDEEGKHMRRAIDFKARHHTSIARCNIQLEWHGSGAPSDEWHLQGRLVWERDNDQTFI